MSTIDLYDQRKSFFLQPSVIARGGTKFAILLGIVIFVIGMVTGQETRTWGSFLFNLFFFFSLSLGGIAFSGMQDTVGAVWGRPIMRIQESFASFLPFAAGLLIIFFGCIHFNALSAGEVYLWIRNPDFLDHFWGKKTWLQPGFMMIRDTVAILGITALAMWQLKRKLKGDRLMLDGDRKEAEKVGEETREALRYWSAPILIFYAVAFTLLAFDLTMSLAPAWFSTLWGGWNFAIMMQTLMASTLIFMFAVKKMPMGQLIRRQQFHDIGKLMHGFSIFFAYLTYAHVLTYWYANMPETTEYYIHRLHAPWVYIIIAVPILSFFLPLFALIPKVSKWTAGFTIPICVGILFAQWFTHLIVVIPEMFPDPENTAWTLPWIEFGAFIGFLGLFLSCVFWFGARYPMIPISDPLLPEALEDGH